MCGANKCLIDVIDIFFIQYHRCGRARIENKILYIYSDNARLGLVRPDLLHYDSILSDEWDHEKDFRLSDDDALLLKTLYNAEILPGMLPSQVEQTLKNQGR